MSKNYTDYVNIKQGTFSDMRYSYGNTLPIVAMPFGMNHFSMQTKASDDGWFYHPPHKQLEGIRLTHQPSPWVRDYGHFVMMPQNGEAYVREYERCSGYQEIELKPGYMELYLKRYRVRTNLAATKRCAVMQMRWDELKLPRFAVLPFPFLTHMELDAKTGELTGYTNAHGDGTRKDFLMYFYMQFDQVIDVENTLITEGSGEKRQGLLAEGIGTGMNIAFQMSKADTLTVRVGTSFISLEQAKLNVTGEIGEKTYEEVKAEGENTWNELLARTDVEDTEEKKKTFYSCFHRCFLYPRIFYECNEQGEKIHYSTKDGMVKPGVMYTDNGFWDTYRTLYPLYALIIPDRLKEMLEGYLNFYKEEGWLPKWLSPGERGIMPGTLIDAVLADAAVKGLLSEEQMVLALEGMLKHANIAGETRQNGRIGVTDYVKKGYIPCDKHGESVNNALDAYYCDFCISQIAGLLHKVDTQMAYKKRAANYKVLFDEKVGFIHGLDSNGKFSENFSPINWGGEYCEGGAWQNAFSVFHDVEGFAALYGGRKKLAEKLDELFATAPVYNVGTYGQEIHEMTEMACADFGQCAISNQPSFHLPYYYAMLGYPQETAYWVRRIAEEAFNSSEKGFPGDEDNGSMSAWYVFSALGMYPFCPGKAEYVWGVSTVNKALLHLENGKTVHIENTLPKEASKKPFQVLLDGRVLDTQMITHAQLINAENILFCEEG